MYNPAPLSPAPALFEVEAEAEVERETEIERETGIEATSASDASASPQDWRNELAGPDDIPELIPELATRRSAATSYGDLAAIIRLQSTEIERLALENDRIAEKLDDVHRLHDAEQAVRRDLERRVLDLSARAEPPAPAVDGEEMRRAARDSMSAEIKPVLISILDLLEAALPRNQQAAVGRPAVTETPAETPSAPPPPSYQNTPGLEEFLRLPDILTRPLEELTTRAIEPEPKPSPAIEPRPAEALPTERVGYRPPPRPALPAMFAWFSLFS